MHEPSAWRWINAPAIGAIHVYRICLSPLLGGQCRFHPTCSAYALEAYRSRDPVRASWLVVRRLLRCHPWGGAGHDPVPPVRPQRGTAADPGASDG
ncbi:MAG: membrane protein insertion efficiency factor YidD [Phycisphaerales bacterium]|nr:membrane protein insertion efficiency factor YidD [Phycisphaerales bacterium]